MNRYCLSDVRALLMMNGKQIVGWECPMCKRVNAGEIPHACSSSCDACGAIFEVHGNALDHIGWKRFDVVDATRSNDVWFVDVPNEHYRPSQSNPNRLRPYYIPRSERNKPMS